MFTLLYWVCVCVFLLPVASLSHIEVDDEGGYKKIVIAVTERMLEANSDLVLLESNLKEFFLRVSEKLFVATRHQVFFKEIHVLLPNLPYSQIDGGRINIGNSTFESYQEADIRLDTYNPVPERGSLYTNQPRGCRKRGDFIYLNPDIITGWISKTNHTTVHKFVQEWSKFRYGVFEETGDNSDIFPNTYMSVNGVRKETGCFTQRNSSASIMDNPNLQGDTFCDNSRDHLHDQFAPNRQNAFCKTESTWNVVKESKDFDRLTPEPNMNIPVPKINFVKLLAQTVIIIEPTLCKDDCHKKNNHILTLALKKFIHELPNYVQLRFIIAIRTPITLDFDSKLQKNEFIKKILNELAIANKNSPSDIPAGIMKGKEMLKDYPGNKILVLFVVGSGFFPGSVTSTIFSTWDKLNFFLVTWAENNIQLRFTNDNDLRTLKNFVNYSTRNLWININVKGTMSECDVNSRLQIETAFYEFYIKFLLQDFYSPRIKVNHYEVKTNEAQKILLPFSNATVVFDILGCKYDNNDQKLKMTINNVAQNVDCDEKEMEKDSSFSYKWQNPKYDNNEISFEVSMSNSDSLGASVWVEIPITTQQFQLTPIDAKLENADVNKENSPLIFYSYNPSNFLLEIQIFYQDGNPVFSVYLNDNGNGDPDVIPKDKIYSHYFVSASPLKDVCSVKIIAKNEIGNIVDQRNLGTIYLPSQNIDQFPPNRIIDFSVKAENSHSVVFSWTAPGGHYDFGSALSYYMQCSENFSDVIAMSSSIPRINDSINLIPQPSGNREEYRYEWIITPPETNNYCIVASRNPRLFSEWSNIIHIPKYQLTTTSTEKVSTMQEFLNTTMTPAGQVSTMEVPQSTSITSSEKVSTMQESKNKTENESTTKKFQITTQSSELDSDLMTTTPQTPQKDNDPMTTTPRTPQNDNDLMTTNPRTPRSNSVEISDSNIIQTSTEEHSTSYIISIVNSCVLILLFLFILFVFRHIRRYHLKERFTSNLAQNSSIELSLSKNNLDITNQQSQTVGNIYSDPSVVTQTDYYDDTGERASYFMIHTNASFNGNDEANFSNSIPDGNVTAQNPEENTLQDDGYLNLNAISHDGQQYEQIGQ